jgi:hypothetical protein
LEKSEAAALHRKTIMKSDLKSPGARRILAVGFVLIAQSLALIPQAVLAQSVRVAGQQIFSVSTGTSSLSSSKRAETIQSNLDNAIMATKDKGSQAVSIIYVNGLPVITLAGYQICTVDGADAKAANTTPALLAEKWSDALRKSMNDKASISSYISQLSGAANSGNSGGSGSNSNSNSSNNNNGNTSNNNNSSNGRNNSSSNFGSNSNSNNNNSNLSNNDSNSSYGNGNSNNGSSNGNGNSGSNAYTSSVPDTYATSPNPPSAPQLQPLQPTYAQPQTANTNPPYAPASNAAFGYTSYSVPPPNYSAPPTNYLPPQQAYIPPSNYPSPPYYGGSQRGPAAPPVTAPAGTVISAMLKISISTDVAQNGDLVEASILDAIPLQNGSIPAGSTLLGQITEARQSGRLSQSGHLGMKFTSLRTPDGVSSPIQAHLTGLVGKYKLNGKGDDTYLHGEGGKAKLGQTLIRGGVGAGAGAALGTAVGAIAGGPFGAGTGAWSGAAIGGGIGVGDMALRKGREVKLESGTRMQIQLDQPATIQGTAQSLVQGGNI